MKSIQVLTLGIALALVSGYVQASSKSGEASCRVSARGKKSLSCLGIGGSPKMIEESKERKQLNVLGTPLKTCCTDPMTGFFRTGSCETDSRDRGVHTVCATLTQEFLEFSRSKGNDLMTPVPEFGFQGLKAGQKWCLCAARWLEAEKAGLAPPIDLEATHAKTLDIVSLDILKKYQIH